LRKAIKEEGGENKGENIPIMTPKEEKGAQAENGVSVKQTPRDGNT
jgi:hypothetical protein